MSKTVDLSLSLRAKQYIVAAGVSWFVSVPAAGVVLAVSDLPTGVALAGGVAGWLLLAVLWVRRLGGEDDAGAWDAIPRWQYDGRLVEAGGPTRSEQAETLEDVGDKR